MRRAVVLAMGASYRRLGVETLETFYGAGVFYGAAGLGGSVRAGRGGVCRRGRELGRAGRAAPGPLRATRHARRTGRVARGAMSHYLVRQIKATPNIDVRSGTEVVDGGGGGRLEHLVLRDTASDEEATVNAQALFLMIGARPHTEWLPPTIERDSDGFVFTGPDLERRRALAPRSPPFALETSLPGVLAVGDVRHGSVKRVASAVGEGSIAIQLAHRLLADPKDQTLRSP